MQELLLIRGLPGSGKSTMAREMKDYVHLEADQFFESSGRYDFDPAFLPDAHNWCKSMATYYLRGGKSVVVSNTFSQQWEVDPYIDIAVKCGVKIRIIEATGRFKSIHHIPDEAYQRMVDRWEQVELTKELV